MIYKFKGKENGISFITLLYNDKLQLIHATPYPMDYDLRNNSYSDFQLDNEGNMFFTRSKKLNGSDDLASVDLLIKNSLQDSFSIKNINHGWYNMNIHVDNANKRYLLNSFYYMQPQENIEGIYSTVWDAKGDSMYGSRLTPFPDTIRKIARKSGEMNTAFNGYFIRNVILKKDGGYILVADDWYDCNILVCSISNIGVIEWYNIILTYQSIHLPFIFSYFSTFTSSERVHFLYNSSNKRKLLLLDNTVSEDGKITRNPPLKNEENGCDFMIRYAKKTGARELVIPCLHRGKICFAKVDF